MRTIIIVAMTPEGLIGKSGGLPWHIPADLKHFQRTTQGHAVIMGRKTYDSVGKPLPRRRNIVISHDAYAMTPIAGNMTDGTMRTSLEVAGSLAEALDICRLRNEEKAFVAGGSQIFAMGLNVADEMLITWVHELDLTGDTFFPNWDRSQWSATPVPHTDGIDLVSYRRKQ